LFFCFLSIHFPRLRAGTAAVSAGGIGAAGSRGVNDAFTQLGDMIHGADSSGGRGRPVVHAGIHPCRTSD
jgi:hypothetical protein